MEYIYRDKVLQLFKDLLKDSFELRLLFENINSIDKLYVQYKILQKSYQEIENL
jgi:hypothetical protein